jgi:putative nucleotidyltransferase with HDIG domain
MALRAHRSAGLVRSLALLWVFLLASGAILAVGAFVLSSVLTSSLRDQALVDNARYASGYANAVLTPALVRGKRVRVTSTAKQRVRSAIRRQRYVTGISIWNRQGKLLYSTRGRRRSARPDDEVFRVARSRRADAEVASVATKPGGSRRTRRAILAWAPLAIPGRPLAGVAELTLRPDSLDATVGGARRTLVLSVAAVFASLWLALVLLVSGASARLTRQNKAFQGRSRDLLDSTRSLEANLRETVETLNAAVEARDPYTAGHSQRVRRVALAIGRELGLGTKQLGALGTAALFHDVGKIGIPDSILTKTGALEPAEAAVMREHVTRSAEIVAKVSSFQDAVPAIRHHHERWDGLGYPDGLSGDEIPIEAAIIGLADAWDAMTTDRPYAVALSLNDALMQIRTGRGKHFNPAVVDAFTEVARRRPAEILPPESPSASVAAV